MAAIRATLLVLLIVLLLSLACTGNVPEPAPTPALTATPMATPTALASTTAPTPSPFLAATPMPTPNQISKANQEYLEQVGVTSVLTPEEKAAAIGVSKYMMVLTDCYVEKTAQALERPRGGVFAQLPYFSEVFGAGSILAADQMITYQREHFNRDVIVSVVEPCLLEAYAYSNDAEAETESQESIEVGKAGAVVAFTGLLSPDMEYNCQEWVRTHHTNYLSDREGSVQRRGEAAGLRFDYAWGKAKEAIHLACSADDQ